MKTFLLLAFSLTTALSQVASAADQDQVTPPKRAQAPARNTAVNQGPRVRPNVTVHQQGPVYQAPRFNPAYTNQTLRMHSRVNQDLVRSNRFNNPNQFTPRVRRNPNVVTTPQTTTTAQSNVNTLNRFDRDARNRTTINSQNRTSGNFNWADARRRHDRNRHDRSWWTSRYNRFALFGGGYYFWDNNYWYPAYGYDAYYNSYSYDEPIYGDQDMDPGQVISSVQTELQRLGYYRYAVDGLMGPATRAAIANFQRDNGLAMTSAIDGPTLQSLGLR